VDAHLSGVSLLEADFTTLCFAPHLHEAMVITTVQEGGAVITTRGASDAVGRPHLYLCNPAEPHSSRMGRSNRWRFCSIYLAHGALTDLATHFGVPALPYFKGNVFADGDMIRRLAVLQALLGDGSDIEQKREAIVLAMGQLFHRYGGVKDEARRDDVVVRAMKRTIDSRFAEGVSLENLAAGAGLSVWQLLGMFKRTIGMTPHAYLTQVRLNAVCRHLRRGVPIAAASAAAGFYDQSALTSHFKNRFGVTPLQFAAATQARPIHH
jgi:AraC-like DNA-binding protein